MDVETVGTVAVWAFAGIGAIAILCVFIGWLSARDDRKRSEDADARNNRRLTTEWDAIEQVNRIIQGVPHDQRGEWWEALDASTDRAVDDWNNRNREQRWKEILH